MFVGWPSNASKWTGRGNVRCLLARSGTTPNDHQHRLPSTLLRISLSYLPTDLSACALLSAPSSVSLAVRTRSLRGTRTPPSLPPAFTLLSAPRERAPSTGQQTNTDDELIQRTQVGRTHTDSHRSVPSSVCRDDSGEVKARSSGWRGEAASFGIELAGASTDPAERTFRALHPTKPHY